MQIYMNAMKQCYLTLKQKQRAYYRGQRELQLNDFSYFAFHTPFSKMVQKSFMALILADIEQTFKQEGLQGASKHYPSDLVQQLANSGFKNDAKTLAMLSKQFAAQW